MKWQYTNIINDAGHQVLAQAPVIISASRSTDIPTFYSDWFFERWKRGYLSWKNPFNGVSLFVSFEKARLVVFWTKNPRPMFKNFSILEDLVPNFYFHYSLNNYDKEGLEGKVPNVDSRIETFIALAERIGKEKVIWRFDPMVLTSKIGVDELLNKAEYIGNNLVGHTQKMVISFGDISIYPRVENNLRKEGIEYIEFTEPLMREVAEGLKKLNQKWGFEIATCSEKIELDKFGITHNKCIDDDLIIKLFQKDKALMDFLGVEFVEPTLFEKGDILRKKMSLKDKGQRETCGCIMSKDIGQYNTCPHECTYCYANTSREMALKNYKKHLLNPLTESIIGE
jgi:DNA repair photolyase